VTQITGDGATGNLSAGFLPGVNRYEYWYDELREFWPEIARAFKLPFRVEYESAAPTPAPVQ
jgi:hypothetical protein